MSQSQPSNTSHSNAKWVFVIVLLVLIAITGVTLVVQQASYRSKTAADSEKTSNQDGLAECINRSVDQANNDLSASAVSTSTGANGEITYKTPPGVKEKIDAAKNGRDAICYKTYGANN